MNEWIIKCWNAKVNGHEDRHRNCKKSSNFYSQCTLLFMQSTMLQWMETAKVCMWLLSQVFSAITAFLFLSFDLFSKFRYFLLWQWIIGTPAKGRLALLDSEHWLRIIPQLRTTPMSLMTWWLTTRNSSARRGLRAEPPKCRLWLDDLLHAIAVPGVGWGLSPQNVTYDLMTYYCLLYTSPSPRD